MISLISAKDVRNRLALPDDEGINASIKSCIVGATLRASSLLQTDFDPIRILSVFFISEEIEVANGGLYTLRLPNGFAAEGMTVRVGDTFEEMIAGGGTILGTDYFNLEKGWVYVLKSDTVGKYVSVLADHGFISSATIPEWLKEVVLGLTIKMLSFQQVSDEATLSNIIPTLDQHIFSLVDNHKRSGSWILPVYTTADSVESDVRSMVYYREQYDA